MAEAAVDQRPSRFFCHMCSVSISPTLPDYTCPRCESGFIEEIEDMAEDLGLVEEQPAQSQPSDLDPAAQFAELWGRTFLESLHMQTNRPNERSNDSDSSDPETDLNIGADGEADEPAATTLLQRGNPFPRSVTFRRIGGQQTGHHPAIESIVQRLLRGLTEGAMFGRGGFPVNTMFSLYGNPGDYAWGAGGLDHIISQLLNQLDGTGPPPAAKSQIEALPSINITQAQVDKNLQCSVCMEDFKLDELVRRLPCNHHYHSDCITPWLELHGTCPVCRKNLDGEDTSTGPAAGTAPQTANLNGNQAGSSSQSSSSQQESSSQSGRNMSRFDFIDEYD